MQETIPLEVDENEKIFEFLRGTLTKSDVEPLKQNLTRAGKPFMSFGMLLVMKSILKQDFYLKVE